MAKKMLPSLFLAVLVIGGNLRMNGQALADTIRNEIHAINKAYDSAFFLTFNVKMNYRSDTLWAGTDSADFNNSEVEGMYTFHRKKALYQLGDITYLQNDSFAIALYNEQKLLMVGKIIPGVQTGSFLPTRTLVDSMTTQLVQLFSYTLSKSDSVNIIQMTALDSNAAYESIRMAYEPSTHYLLHVHFRMKDYGYEMNSASAGSGIIRKADMDIQFSHYRVSQISAAVFNESQFIYFDGPDSIRPADRYRDYTIYKNY
ncbi:MAG: hypothetical protein NTW29_09035 [Bacteroidetes bacterium]|nr:hypothetical protein [Bacteroidota bacterium]